MNLKKAGSALPLFLAALIWGLSFVAQSNGMEVVEAFTFNGVRTVVGALSLMPFAIRNCIKGGFSFKKKESRTLLIGGLLCGLCLFVAHNLQQFAFNYTTSGKIGFLTALYMIQVPILGLFLKKKTSPIVWFSVLIAAVGVFLLCVNGDLSSFGKGEILALCCSFMFAVHIIVADKYSPLVDCISLSFLQFTVSGVLTCICMFIFEEPVVSDILSITPEILYAGVMTCGVAFTLQLIGQKNTDPTVASILLCLESVFSVIFGWIILDEALSPKEILGCVIMFIAIILTQLPESLFKRSKKGSRLNG
ncbi:MAG: DMT family transporter [Clostridia bacterium]|nr:DMT family transporter [Clostridia bacterium]